MLPDVLTGGAGREVSTGGKPGYDCSRFRLRSALPLRPPNTTVFYCTSGKIIKRRELATHKCPPRSVLSFFYLPACLPACGLFVLFPHDRQRDPAQAALQDALHVRTGEASARRVEVLEAAGVSITSQRCKVEPGW